MGKNVVAKGKIANKLASKKNKNLLKGTNKKILDKTKGIGAKEKTFDAPTKKVKTLKNEKKKGAQKIVELAKPKEEEELVLPDADMIDSDQDSDNDMAFLDSVADNKQIAKLQKQRKRQLENVGEDFETAKRSFGDSKEDPRKKRMLPVLNADGDVQERYKDVDHVRLMDEETDSEEEEEKNEDGSKKLTMEEVIELQKKQTQDWQQRLASIANRTTSNPEQHAHAALRLVLKALHFEGENQYLPIKIRQMAILTAGAILTDILPSYRIRKLTEEEKNEKLKKEVRALRNYEQGLLEYYQKFLKRMEFFLMLYKSPAMLKRKTGVRNRRNVVEADPLEVISKPARVVIARSVAKVMAKLMVSTMQFNYNDNLIETLIPYINDTDETIGDLVQEAIIELFKTDRTSQKVLAVVRKIAAVVRAKGQKTDQRVMECLLHLKIKQVETRQGKDHRDNDRNKVDRNKVSRAQNKQRKREAKLQIELKETQAVENQKDRLYFNSQSIEAVFGIFFRILKSIRCSKLLSPTLIGIGRYGHLINLDLIGPLLSLLTDVMADTSVIVSNRLKCARSACALLTGEGEDLLVDPKQLYLHAYRILDKITIESKDKAKDLGDPWPALFDVLHALLIERKSQLTNGRVNAFLHRIMTTAVRLTKKHQQESTAYVLGLLLIVRAVMISHRCAASCFDDEAEQSSLPVDKLDPDLVVANRVACTKELEEVKKHPNKLVEILVKHIEAGAPSNVALPRNMARKPPTVIYRETKYGQFKDRK